MINECSKLGVCLDDIDTCRIHKHPQKKQKLEIIT